MRRSSGGAGFAPSMSAQDFQIGLLQSGAAQARFAVPGGCWSCVNTTSFEARDVAIRGRGQVRCVVCQDCAAVIREATQAEAGAAGPDELRRAA